MKKVLIGEIFFDEIMGKATILMRKRKWENKTLKLDIYQDILYDATRNYDITMEDWKKDLLLTKGDEL